MPTPYTPILGASAPTLITSSNSSKATETGVFPADFEGFGLPVVEGMALGKPVVIGPGKVSMEISVGLAVVMSEWTAEALADAVTTARAMTADESSMPRKTQHARIDSPY